MTQNIKVDDLADAIIEELEMYDQQVTEGMKESCKEEAELCVKEIQSNSPVSHGKHGGRYKKGWRAKIVYEDDSDIRITIHNIHYRLPHLLEYGHVTQNGGRVEGRPHIAPAAKNAEDGFMGKIKVVIKR